MKVFFVIDAAMESGDTTLLNPHFPHLGIAYLSAVLKKNNHEVNLLDMRFWYPMGKLIDRINAFSPDIIGFTTYSFRYSQAYKTIEKLKAVFADIPLIIGGPHVAAFGKSVLQDSRADFALRGEGEDAILEFCDAIGNKCEDFSHIAGLLWRSKGSIMENRARKFIRNLDELPYPSFDEFELDKYTSVRQRKLLPIISSRGCPFGCTFCSVVLSMGRNFRPRSAGNFVDEIEYWHKQGFTTFDINDDNFTMDMKRAHKICDLIQARGLRIKYRFPNGIRADRLDLPLAEKMRRTGCVLVSFGCETGNPEIMKRIKKRTSLDKIVEAVEIGNKIGWTQRVNFIIGHPDETYEKAMDTIRFAEKLPNTILTFFTVIPYPGTELFEWIKKNGRFIYSPEMYLNNIEYVDAKPIFETKEFTKRERKIVLKKGTRLTRKSYCQIVFGKKLGTLVFYLIQNEKIWSFTWTLSQGTNWGYKLFNRFVIRKHEGKR